MHPLLFHLGLPYPRYGLRVLGRTGLMWLVVKLFLSVAFPIFGVMPAGEAFVLPTLGIPALLVLVDRVRANERLLGSNLGASEWWLGISTVGLCLALDVIIWAVQSVWGG